MWRCYSLLTLQIWHYAELLFTPASRWRWCTVTSAGVMFTPSCVPHTSAEHKAKSDELFRCGGRVPGPRHSVDTKPALGLLSAIWLSQSGLSLWWCSASTEGEREGEVSKGAFQVPEPNLCCRPFIHNQSDVSRGRMTAVTPENTLYLKWTSNKRWLWCGPAYQARLGWHLWTEINTFSFIYTLHSMHSQVFD